MKKYNIKNYIRYKEDLKESLKNLPNHGVDYDKYTRDHLIVKFMPLVENLARKFSTADQASGVLSILDLFQCGGEGLTKAVDRIDWETINKSEVIFISVPTPSNPDGSMHLGILENIHKYMGQRATFTYFERTKAGSYRHPLF